MLKTIMLVSLFVLSACASQHELAQCHGPLEVLNTDKWHPTPQEIESLSQVCPEGQ